ncbi:MAG: cobaltochelatase subunit CobN [Cyanobacteria bacterium P01_H01_bin.15]
MHRLASRPGGWQPDQGGVFISEQTPAPIVFLSAADTDIQTLGAALTQFPDSFPAIRALNLLQLQQPFSIDEYVDSVLAKAEVVIVRLLGGRAYWSYGLEVLQKITASLWIMPGDENPDLALMDQSTVPLTAVDRFWRYLLEGGATNFAQALRYLSDEVWGTHYQPALPEAVPRVGVYPQPQSQSPELPRVGILFYRAHYLSGNVSAIEVLSQALLQVGLVPVVVFVSAMQDSSVRQEVWHILRSQNIEILINTTSFSWQRLENHAQAPDWLPLDVPILQAILSSSPESDWVESWSGLTPRDVAMNVALPEVDGRLITRAIAFKQSNFFHPQLETEIVTYQAIPDRLTWLAKLAANWVQLRRTAVCDRKVALILANYPNRDGRLANGVGLDTPASCIKILNALQEEGYDLKDFPASSSDLIDALTAGPTNDPEGRAIRSAKQILSPQVFQRFWQQLPTAVKDRLVMRWGEPDLTKSYVIPGLNLGNVFIGIQPSRGYDRDPSLNYHAPDLEPTYEYLAYYCWLRETFQVQAVVHVGKHGNLEWLPGKSVALSENCFPEIALGPLPHLYPFIVNDPGEGSQAKRRAQAVILDHLTPPLTRAELYGPLVKLENLVDEYYEAQALDPSRLTLIGERLVQLITETNLAQDLGLPTPNSDTLGPFLGTLDGYLCELKEAQIRDGLHIYGQYPESNQLRDLLVAIARAPSRERTGLTFAIANDLGLIDFNPLTCELAESVQADLLNLFPDCRINGDVVERIEAIASQQVEALLHERSGATTGPATTQILDWLKTDLLPRLREGCQAEIANLLKGLAGQFVPSGPAGAPTRGRPDVLPTGRNFFSVDIRAIPTETAWSVGRLAAEAVVERYTQEQGDYPRTLAISIWSTSTMRTGGDDVAQVLALLGVQPIWDGPSRRVVDFEILPISILGRPRVDVTVRVSGCFRDSFPNLLRLLHDAIAAVAALPESAEDNPLAATVVEDSQRLCEHGLNPIQAQQEASYRVFGSKPGGYGAGLQGLIESQNWETEADLAQAYLNWSSYAYIPNGRDVEGISAPTAFQSRLEQLQIVLHNQDNREHDLLDSDDYYQFQGGLTVATRHLSGKDPIVYFGDNSVVSNPKVRALQEEISRVYRSRVVNPKWIEGVMRHGYKGAFEMAATVDYLFGYDATTHTVADFMYEGIAERYLLDPQVQAFVQTNNPWALRDMSERLLEAVQRGLWQSPSPNMLEQLKSLANQAEGQIEKTLDR